MSNNVFASLCYVLYAHSVRGGTGYVHTMYPDALTAVVHGCAELDKETDTKQVEHVKSTSASNKKVVKNVSSHKNVRVDNEMFERLNDKLFPHHEEQHDEKKVADEAKISYAHEFLQEDDFYE